MRFAWSGWFGGLGLLGGCFLAEDPETVPPTLTEIRLVEADTLRLSFSEYVYPTSPLEVGVFRLSAAISRNGSTYYYAMNATDDDLGGGDDTGASESSGTDAGDSDSSGTAGLAAAHDDPNGLGVPRPEQRVLDAVIREVETPIDLYARPIHDELEIELFEPISDMPGCERLRGIPAAQAGVFLHYRPSGDKAVADIEDNALRPIGEHWVRDEALPSTEVPGTFPSLHPRFPIPCP